MNDFIAEPFINGDFEDPMPADHGVGETVGSVTYYRNLVQGSDEWFKLRLGVLTASEVRMIFGLSNSTPCGAKIKTGEPCSRSVEDGFSTCKQHRTQEDTAAVHKRVWGVTTNDKTGQHVYELAAQRISQFIEPSYIGDAMLRGHEDEVEARITYNEKVAPVREMGFITNSKWGFTLGYSPDGLVGDKGGIECKSRIQKFQVQTIAEHVHDNKNTTIPAEFMAQCQTGMLVAELEWIDFISYSGGLPMVVIRVHRDDEIQAAIIDAATEFEMKIQERIIAYRAGLKSPETRAFPTVRRIEEDMMV